MLRKLTTLVITIAAGAMAAACAAGQAASEHHDESAPDYLAESDIARIAEQAHGFQKEILADRKVTFGEYEKATLATVECIRKAKLAQGQLTVNGPYPRKLGSGKIDDRFLSYDVELTSDPGSAGTPMAEWQIAVRAGVDRITGECRDTYLTDVDRVWTFAHLLTPAQRDEQRAKIIGCLRGAGHQLAPDADAEKIFELMGQHRENAAVINCRDSYPDFFVLGVI